MAGLFCSSCNGYTSISSSVPGPFASITGTATLNAGAGPSGVNTITLSEGGQLLIPGVTLMQPTGFVLGFGCNIAASGDVGSICGFGAGGGNDAWCVVNADGSMELTVYNGNVLTTASGVFTFGTRHFIEIYAESVANNATWKIRVDDVVMISGNIGDATVLQNPLTTVTVGQVQVGGAVATFDSIYLLDTSTDYNKSPLGPGVVALYQPSANGNYNAWAASSGTNYAALDNIPPNGDALYVYDDTEGDNQSCAMTSDLPFSSVSFVCVECTARQENSGGGRTLAIGVCNAGGMGGPQVGSPLGLTTDYQTFVQPFSINPLAEAPWSPITLGSIQALIQVAS